MMLSAGYGFGGEFLGEYASNYSLTSRETRYATFLPSETGKSFRLKLELCTGSVDRFSCTLAGGFDLCMAVANDFLDNVKEGAVA